jgi:putative transposase
MEVVDQHRDIAGVKPLCAALDVSRETYYRRRRPAPRFHVSRPTSTRALSAHERQAALDALHSERFIDRTPAEVHASLLDEGTYLCSLRTMYRILAGEHEVRERRNQARHPQYVKPQLLATGPNEVWSWDITKLLGPEKWTYFHLYVILDIFSRYAVGWMLARSESAELASKLIRETCSKHTIDEGKLTIHSDRGPAMISKTVAQMLADLGVEKSLSRPHTSNDNPFIESHFKTLKYAPGFPDRFHGGYDEALNHCRRFFGWYNNEHHHSALAELTPADVHFGHADHVLALRENVLRTAFRRHPERFVRGMPSVPSLAEAVWINPPSDVGAAHPVEPRRARDVFAMTSHDITHCSLNS